MGKTILTPYQYQFLELVCRQPQIVKRFYLTGGTGLAEFYYRHRLSEDIDLFCENEEVDQSVVEAFLKKSSIKLKVVEIKRSLFLGLFSYTLIYADGSKLKVDFNFYPFPRIAKGKIYKGLSIDSIYDIAVNKVHTMFMKPRPRDYVDLYFILTKEKYPLEKLILDAKAKFDWDIDRITLGSQFKRVVDFFEMPQMLVPFNKRRMEKFFLGLAKSLEPEIFKNPKSSGL